MNKGSGNESGAKSKAPAPASRSKTPEQARTLSQSQEFLMWDRDRVTKKRHNIKVEDGADGINLKIGHLMDDRDEIFGYLKETIQQITQLEQGQTQSNETITQMRQEIEQFQQNTKQSSDMITRIKNECGVTDGRFTEVGNDVVQLVKDYQAKVRDLEDVRDNLQLQINEHEKSTAVVAGGDAGSTAPDIYKQTNDALLKAIGKDRIADVDNSGLQAIKDLIDFQDNLIDMLSVGMANKVERKNKC